MIPVAIVPQTQPAVRVPDLADRLESIVTSPRNHNIDYGVLVVDKDGKVLYSHGADSKLIPASNMKILTHVFAFSKLGGQYRPVTKFWKQNQEVIVDAPGDPDISVDQLSKVRQKLGLVDGCNVKLHGRFRGGYPDGWSSDDYQYRYGSSIYPFTANRALVTLMSQDKKLVRPLDSAGLLVFRGKEAGALDTRYDFWARMVTVDGAFAPKRAVVAEIPAPDPQNYACGLLGGSLGASDTVPDRAPDAVIEGKSLEVMAVECLKPSDNRMAELILQLSAQCDLETCKTVTAQQYWADSFNVASGRLQRFFYDHVGVVPGDLHTFDGSGLSRKDHVTVRAMVKVLQFAKGEPFAKMFINALPHSGEGTLRSRLKELDVSAKTGTLHDVSALSGYIGAKTGDPVIFSIIGNTHGRAASAVRETADKLVREIAADTVHHGPARPNPLPPSLPNTGNGSAPGHRAH